LLFFLISERLAGGGREAEGVGGEGEKREVLKKGEGNLRRDYFASPIPTTLRIILLSS
jgi:hypothetical protein